jgi:hypothetical protein
MVLSMSLQSIPDEYTEFRQHIIITTSKVSPLTGKICDREGMTVQSRLIPCTESAIYMRTQRMRISD